MLKNNTIRAISLSHSSFRQRAIGIATRVLLANDYPPLLINLCLDKITSRLSNNNLEKTDPPDPPCIYIPFPFTNHTTNHRIKKVISQYIPESRLVNSQVTKNTIFSNLKTPYPSQKRIDLIYKITFTDCDNF